MSTAGKVLTVIVTLAIVGWIVLIAQVADLNRNWGKELDQLQANIQKLEQETGTVKGQIQQTLADIRLQQEEKDRELSVIRTRISKLAKLLAQDQQALSDVQLEVAQVVAATKDAEAAAQKRAAELAQTQKDLATAQADVQGLQQSVGSLMGELQRLQTSFIATLKDNQQLLQQLRGRTASGPRTRPASFTR